MVPLHRRVFHPHISLLRNLVRTMATASPHCGAPEWLTHLVLGRAKKARVTLSEDDALIESDDQDGSASAFSQALSRFKKSPKKKGQLDNYSACIYLLRIH
jgi:hypothetical protein